MVTNDERAAFSARLNQALDAAGVPPKSRGRQVTVGHMFGVSQKGARKWLEGESMPSLKRLPDIARELGCTVEWLLTGKGMGPQGASYPSRIQESHLERSILMLPGDDDAAIAEPSDQGRSESYACSEAERFRERIWRLTADLTASQRKQLIEMLETINRRNQRDAFLLRRLNQA